MICNKPLPAEPVVQHHLNAGNAKCATCGAGPLPVTLLDETWQFDEPEHQIPTPAEGIPAGMIARHRDWCFNCKTDEQMYAHEVSGASSF